MRAALLMLCEAVLLSSCVQAADSPPSVRPGELLDFAEASCFLQYFEKKGYDLEDIRAISGGIVERGSFAPEQYEQVSLLVKSYRPPLKTKQQIDLDLLKCFTLKDDPAFLHSLAKAQ